MKEQWILRAVCVTATILVSLATWTGPASAGSPEPTGRAEHSPAELTKADADSFLESLVPYLLERENIAGGVVSIVKDGALLTARGFGYADFENRKAVDVNRTEFRMASISKLFTWTAVMQQVEQGRLNLDSDVNQYLDFRIPEAFGKPITLRHCMTHTSGFEDVSKNMVVAEAAELTPLGAWLKAHVPKRITPPGDTIAYSNYCTTLAGYIVERAAGEPFAQYVAGHVLSPLAMEGTTLEQKLPPAIAEQMSTGYGRSSDGAKPFEYFNVVPAGGVTSTAIDMARFMTGYLKGGVGERGRFLSEASVREMWTHQTSLVPGMNGWALGFYETDRNGEHIVGHGGDSAWFHTDIMLFPDRNVGLFMAFNSAGDDAGGARVARMALTREFLDRYFPASVPEESTAATAKADSGRVAGFYALSRRGASAMQLAGAISQIEVAAMPDGQLELRPFFTNYGGVMKRWREVGPLKYREVGGRSELAFKVDAAGQPTAWTTDEYPSVFVFTRISGAIQLGVLRLLVPAAVGVLLLAPLASGLAAVIRRRYRFTTPIAPEDKLLHRWSRAASIIQLIFIGWTVWLMSYVGDSDFTPSFVDALIFVRAILAWLAIVGAVFLIYFAGRGWSRAVRPLWVRVGETMVAFSGLYVVWAIVEFQLGSFSTHF